MSNVFTAAGTTIGISATLPATFDQSGYEALTYLLVGEITGLPEHGPAYTLVTHNPLGSRVTVKRKGSVDYGSFAMPLALDPLDNGQKTALTFANGVNVDNSAAFEITYPDGSVEYFTAQVLSFLRAADSVDSITSGSIALEIDRTVIYVDNETT